MKLRLLATWFSIFAVAACATSANSGVGGAPGDGTTPPGEQPAEEEEDVTKQPPHSLGTIALGESHTSGASSKSTPIVVASFLPDAILGKSCKKKIDGCEIAEVPKCSKTSTSTTGCNSDELCSFDTACEATCKKLPVCEKACSEDEVCKLASSTASKGTCVKSESFDAGPLAFSGTTTSITMFPPYRFESTGQGAPFLGGAQLEVQAQGATEAGFEKFSEKFTATTFLQTTPSLAKIDRNKIFGTGAVPIAWVPSTDTIVITVSGVGGSATCKVKDTLGKFDVPRSVVKAVQTTTGSTTTTSSLSISVSRMKKEVKKDKKAKGELAIATVKPEGWLELITTSTESASFQGCPGTQSFCDEACTSLQTDRYNCGSCGNECSSSQSCYQGACSGGSSSGSSGTPTSCSSCRSAASTGTCSTYNSACSNDFNCDDIRYCAQSCTTSSCVASCEATYPSGQAKYAPLRNCLTSACSSSCGF